MLSTIPYISPHICKVLPLLKQDKAMAACVLTRMHDCENICPKISHEIIHLCSVQYSIYGEYML